MSCRHCCINSKKSFSKTFSFHKIVYKYFAGFLACYLDCHASLCSARNDEKILSLRGYCRSNPKYMLCFFDNNVASAHCVNNSKRSTQGVRHRRPVGKASCYKKLDCFTTVRTRCAPHGDDDNKTFQFDKFQRLLSVIYKKNLLITKEISK